MQPLETHEIKCQRTEMNGGIGSEKGKNLHGWQQSSVRMRAKPQLPPQPSSNRIWLAACCVRDAPPDGSTEFPGSLALGSVALRPCKDLLPETFPGSGVEGKDRFLMGGQGEAGRGLETEKRTNHPCEIFPFAFLRETRKKKKGGKRSFEMLWFYVKPVS